MRVRCLHGYFIFQEMRQGQISDFISLTGMKLISIDDFFTFKALENAPDYSIKTKLIIDSPAIVNFAGEPWEVFEANQLVYDFTKDLIVPISSITRIVKIDTGNNHYISSGLILPGSVKEDGKRVKDYAAWFSRDTLTWKYTEVGYV